MKYDTDEYLHSGGIKMADKNGEWQKIYLLDKALEESSSIVVLKNMIGRSSDHSLAKKREHMGSWQHKLSIGWSNIYTV